MRFLITPQVIPAPPPPAGIDPYRPNPYIVQARRYFYFHIPKAEYTQARAGYQVKYAINTRGFRGPELAVPKAEGIKRLVVIGDSIVEGHGNAFNKTFSYLLNEQLGNALCSGKADWATGRYLSSNWDVHELLQMKDQIIKDDLLVNRLRTKG